MIPAFRCPKGPRQPDVVLSALPPLKMCWLLLPARDIPTSVLFLFLFALPRPCPAAHLDDQKCQNAHASPSSCPLPAPRRCARRQQPRPTQCPIYQQIPHELAGARSAPLRGIYLRLGARFRLCCCQEPRYTISLLPSHKWAELQSEPEAQPEAEPEAATKAEAIGRYYRVVAPSRVVAFLLCDSSDSRRWRWPDSNH